MVDYYRIKIINPELSLIRILYYEFWLANKIPINETDNDIEDNMRIEAFLLHARNIIEFLDCSGHLKASEFFDISDNKIGKTDFLPKKVVERINEYLSHISTKRTKEKIIWDLPLIRRDINAKFCDFLDKLSPNYFPSKEGIIKDNFTKLIQGDIIS